MRVITPYLIALITLTIAFGLLTARTSGNQSPLGNVHWGTVVLASILLLGAALLSAARRWSYRIWVLAGLLVLLGLLLPSSMITEIFPSSGFWPYGSNEALTLFLFLSGAIIITALLLYSVLNLYKKRLNAGEPAIGGSISRQSPVRKVFGLLTLGALVLAKVSHSVYWLLVWDSTTDSLGGLWLILPISAALLSGVLLSLLTTGRMKLIGAGYFLLVTALMIAATASARQVDFRKLTEERAERVSQAIEGYYSEEGHYPQSLRQLHPWYAFPLPGPVILFGQTWCYDGGDSYYRLGYVDREHWSDPRLIGRIYKTGGELPDLPRICEGEVAALRERDPGYPYVYWKEEAK